MVLEQLDKLPKRYDGHTWADYVELLCLVDPDTEVTQAEIDKRITKRRDVGEEYAEPDLDGDGEPEYPVDDISDDADSENDIGSEEGLLDDLRSERIGDIFAVIAFRAHALGAAYPFVLSGDRSVLSRVEQPTEDQRLYLFLLLCSNLRYVPKRRRSPLPRGFEVLSVRAMRHLMPAGAEVHLFGKGEPGERYTGTLWNKISALAADLRDAVIARRRDFPDTNTGDGGLDIVAWAPHPDEQPSRFVVFGQSACTEKWITKQRSSGPEVWATRIRLLALPSNVVFIPHMFRDAQGQWHREADIHHSVLLDRLRLVRMLEGGADACVPEGAVPHVDELLEAAGAG